MASVFISYSRQDMEFAKKLVHFLEEKGHQIWMDKKRILGGANYVKEIANGIGKADIFLPLFSKESIGSKWVEREVYYAESKDKKIVPILVDSTQMPEEIKLVLGAIQYIDFSGQTPTQDPWKELEDALATLDSPAARSDLAVKEKPVYKALHSYLSAKVKHPIPLWAAAIAVLVVIVTGYFLYTGKTSLPQPEKAQFSELAPDVNQVLKLAYTTPLKQPDVQAAAAVFTSKKNAASSGWKPVHNGQELSSDDRYFITMRSRQVSYLYIFQIDSTGKLDWLFPANSFSKDSSGQNPVPAGAITKVPPADRAFYLDENLGVEHLYLVATPGPWAELEAALSQASQAKPLGKPLLANLDIKPRGVAGTESVDFGPAMPGKMASGETQHDFKGIQGALVMDFWFNHVKPK